LGQKTLTSKEAALLLGVSEASVKRWADGGLLPTARTVGGHRRFRPEDVAAFRRANFRGKGGRDARSPPEGEEPPAGAVFEASHAGVREAEGVEPRLFDSLVAGDAETATAIIVTLHLRGQTVGSIADSALCPALRRVGELWHEGLLTITQEHLATRAALVALGALRGSMLRAEPTGLTALCCSVENDFHELPVRLSAAALEARGWEAVVLGTSMPFYALAEAVEMFRPRLVCAAATVLVNPDRAAREYAEFRAAAVSAGAAVALGGAGFVGGPLLRRLPAELHAENFVQLESFAAAVERGAGEGGK